MTQECRKNPVAFKVASVILIAMALSAVASMIYMVSRGIALAGPIGYAVAFVAIPLVAAWGIWRKSAWGVWLGLVFLIPQCINYIGASSSFRFAAPISLGVTIGAGDGASFVVINLFAVVVVLYLLALLKILRNDKLPQQLDLS